MFLKPLPCIWSLFQCILPWKEIISFHFNSEKLEEASRKLINENKLKAGKIWCIIDWSQVAFSNIVYFLFNGIVSLMLQSQEQRDWASKFLFNVVLDQFLQNTVHTCTTRVQNLMIAWCKLMEEDCVRC